MTLVNPDLLIKFTGKTETRNGKEYMYTDNLKLTFTITRYRSIHRIIMPKSFNIEFKNCVFQIVHEL